MDLKCKKCGDPNVGDCLTPEGFCYRCDDGEAVIDSNNVRESMENVVRGLADKIGTTKAIARKRVHEANRGRFD